MRNKLPFIIGCVLGLLIIIYGIRTEKSTLKQPEPNPTSSTPIQIGEDKSGEIIPVSTEGMNVFRNTRHRFSFKYPDAYTVGSFGDTEEGTILLTKKDDQKQGIQIAVTPFDEDIAITPERLQKDIPQIPIIHPQTVVVGNLTHPALVFESHDASGDTYEAWFTDTGMLYEITAGKEAKEVITEILSTWQRE